MVNKNIKIVVPGAAGLVGQNLLVLLNQQGFSNIVVIDKHHKNLEILKKLHPEVTAIEADLAEKDGTWEHAFENADVVVMLQAQIGAPTLEPFTRNTVISTKNVLDVMNSNGSPYLVHISSSVVNSVAKDFYTVTKKEQEKIVKDADFNYCILRPTLMFGWFDRKHLGWLSRFMKKVPVFPIPGHGRYMRQPLYEKDFCNIIIRAIETRPENKAFNITGRDEVDYIDIIRTIKKVNRIKTPIVKIPYGLFYGLMWGYALFSDDPPFTTQQLEALVADDTFELIPWWEIFDVPSTAFKDAMEETFNDPEYSQHILEF